MFNLLTSTANQALIRFAEAVPCKGGDFFGLPPWYKYLQCDKDSTGALSPIFHFPADIWLIAVAIVEMLLRIGGMAAVGYVIYGSIRYITSQGEAENTAAAKSTIMNAIIGLVIILVALVAVNFVGGQLSK